jgi:hypothetical protein
MAAQDTAYHELARRSGLPAAHRYSDPTQDPSQIYQWGTMEAGSTSGLFRREIPTEWFLQDIRD